jgi:hypothetical protein
MAVWSAFIGHAGTHTGYAKIIRTTDEALVKQLKELWQGAGLDAKAAEQRAYQVVALMRGHWLASAIGSDNRRPSAYNAAWLTLLRGDGPSAKVTKLKPAAASKTKKPASEVLPGQLDFGDLFSRG